MWALGIPATTCPGGAGKWRPEYAEILRDKRVVILPDNDPPGEQHALDVARSLLPVAEAAKIVRLPGLPKKGDISDWLDAGHTKEELAEIVKATPILKPEDLPPEHEHKKSLVTLRRPSEVVAPEIRWRIETLLPDRMLTVLHARDKLGKTLLAWEMARAVLPGKLFLETFLTQAGRVVLALLDDPVELTAYRRDALGLSDSTDLRIVTPADADLSDPLKFLDEFRDVCRSFDPGLIVVDALVQFLPSGREAGNDAPRMRPVMQKFNSLAEELGAAVVLIAHDSRHGGDVAGSYVIRATAKTLLHLTQPKWSEEEEDDGRRMLTVTSKLSGEARHLLRLEGVGAWTYVGRGDSARQARTTWAKERVLSWLREGGMGNVQDAAKAVKIRKEDASLALSSLEEEGTVVSEILPRADGRKGKGRRVYRLGNISLEKEGGNIRSDVLQSATDVDSQGIPNVPGASNLTGTLGQAQKAMSGEAIREEESYCSQNPLSRGGNNRFSETEEKDPLTPWGRLSRLSPEDRKRWEERQAEKRAEEERAARYEREERLGMQEQWEDEL